MHICEFPQFLSIIRFNKADKFLGDDRQDKKLLQEQYDLSDCKTQLST